MSTGMERHLVIVWTVCCLSLHLSLCVARQQFHSEEEFDEPPKLFPPKNFTHGPPEALEAADMLNSTNIQHGNVVNATELVDSPHVVDLGGKTHEENGNSTVSCNTYMEETCKIPIDWLTLFENTSHNYVFPDEWLTDSRGMPLVDCSIIMIDNETKIQCLNPSVNKTNETIITSFTTNLSNNDIKLADDVFTACPQFKKLFTTTVTNPTFICSDRIEGNVRITICHIPKKWLKDQTIITKLNCTNNGNSTTNTETCIISKEIVQKNLSHVVNCESTDDNSTACLVPQEWLKYDMFSILPCNEQQNSTLTDCIFPDSLLTTQKQNTCGAGKDGNTTDCPTYSGINCTKDTNTTKLQCQIPQEWLKGGDNVAKLDCTDADTNSTQKVCSIPKEWLRDRLPNVTGAVKENASSEYVCYIPQKYLHDNTSNYQPHCTSDNITTTCQIPNDAANITALCLLFDKIKDMTNVLHCVVKYEANFTTLVCTEPQHNTSNNETESSNTNVSGADVENINPVTEHNSTEIEIEMEKHNSSTNYTQTADVSIKSDQPTEASHSNSNNSSQSPAILVPYSTDTSTESQSASNSLSVKLNTEKDESPVHEGVHYEEIESINKTDGIEVTQASNETNSKISAMQTEEKVHSLQENEIVHYEPASPAAALSQLNSEHNHAPANEQTVTFLRPTESAAILVGVFIAFAVLGYAGLLIWRRMLEKRYGNRQLLINEDDDFSNANNFEMPMYELQERFWPRGVDRGISSSDNTQKSFNKKVPC